MTHTLLASIGSLLADPSQYHNIIRALQYGTITRPNIFFFYQQILPIYAIPNNFSLASY